MGSEVYQQMGQKEDQDKGYKTSDLADTMGAWMKNAMSFWESAPQMKPSDFDYFNFFPKQSEGAGYQAKRSLERGANIAYATAALMGEPENLDALFRAADTAPDFLMKLSRNVWEAYFEARKKWTEHAAKIGKQEKGYDFQGLDHETFEAFREIYEKEFQRFFHVPPIGLARFYQERANRAVDKYNLFQSALSEFIYTFYAPLEKSAAVMQEKIEEMVKKGEVSDNYKEYYSMWVKILESHYEQLLKSPEYISVLDKTINSLVEYRNARDEMMYDFLKNLPIPTNRDMDDLYKEFYELKKKVRELSKKVEGRK
jgi:class III poly(R)-hydroxyalkanoic acid synthase PhaE subunit